MRKNDSENVNKDKAIIRGIKNITCIHEQSFMKKDEIF